MTDILTSIKDVLEVNDTTFNTELLLHINSTLLNLKQLNVNLLISRVEEETTWSQLVGDIEALDAIIIWISYKVKKLFDPPQSQSHMTAIEETIKEAEWRIYISVGGNLNETV